MKEQNTGEVDALREENERLKTAPATPNEADREVAREVVRKIRANTIFHSDDDETEFSFHMTTGQAVAEISRIRADAVKAERERCIRCIRFEMLDDRYLHTLNRLEQAILSDDQDISSKPKASK